MSKAPQSWQDFEDEEEGITDSEEANGKDKAASTIDHDDRTFPPPLAI